MSNASQAKSENATQTKLENAIQTKSETDTSGNGEALTGSDAGTKGRPIACILPPAVHAEFRGKIEKLGEGYTNQSVVVGLVKLWIEGKVELPIPPERIHADAQAALKLLLETDLSRAEKVMKFLADMNKPNQGSPAQK